MVAQLVSITSILELYKMNPDFVDAMKVKDIIDENCDAVTESFKCMQAWSFNAIRERRALFQKPEVTRQKDDCASF